MHTLLEKAIHYTRAGFSMVVVGADKKCIHYWKDCQHTPLRETQLRYQLKRPDATGIAVVCGPISHNLEVLDIDLKYALTPTLFQDFHSFVANYDDLILSTLALAGTLNKGFHFFYQSPVEANSSVLAKRPASKEELASDPDERFRVLIETRAKGGYVLIEPSPGYQFIQGDLFHVPSIDLTTRNLLFDAARSFNIVPTFPARPKATLLRPYDPQSPIDDYNRNGDVIALLESHRWVKVKEDNLRTYVRRPGKANHKTSGDFHHEKRVLKLFSPNTVFETGVGYTPFSVFKILECNEDFKTAMKALLQRGYGVPYNQRHQPSDLQ